MPTKQGGNLQCPICRVESQIEAESSSGELPRWHEAEVGAPVGRKIKIRPSPEVRKASFPATRWPTEEEARLHGFRTIKDWYINCRNQSTEVKLQQEHLEAEFTELSNRHAARAAEQAEANEESSLTVRESQCCTRKCEALLAILEPGSSLGTAETGPLLASPYAFADAEPLACKRVQDHVTQKQVLADTLRAKWAEATTGPPRAVPEMLEGGDDQFRPRLLAAQGNCKECMPFIQAFHPGPK